jgi:folate-dependent phosphoribosylglycinamide formyltransferase PurN
MFGGGPRLEYGARSFVCRLETQPDINFLGAFCQSEGQTLAAVIRDLWHRRRLLTLPLLLSLIVSELGRFLAYPQEHIRLAREMDKLALRIHYVSDIHDSQVLTQVRASNPDLGLIYGSPILKPELFEIPHFGTLGIHHGKVPEYRGKKTTFWAMYNGEETAGVTIQKVNAGLDTGLIVNCGEVIIGSRSRRAVWRELEQLGLDLYIQSILEVRDGKAVYQPQVGKKGKLYRDPSLTQVLELWWRQFWKRLGEFSLRAP